MLPVKREKEYISLFLFLCIFVSFFAVMYLSKYGTIVVYLGALQPRSFLPPVTNNTKIQVKATSSNIIFHTISGQRTRGIQSTIQKA